MKVNISIPGALPRPEWQAGEELTASALFLEQAYFAQRLRRHLRLSHGWGIVCGLNVVPANESNADFGWALLLCPGYGVGPCGGEILVHKPFRFNLRDYLWTRPVRQKQNQLWIAIEASEDPAAYESVPVEGCGGGDRREKISRFTDGFRIVVLWTAPLGSSGDFDICGRAAPECPECPPSCALPLASVTLPALNKAILSSAIHNLGGG